MKSSRFIIPFVVSLVATPLFVFLALVSTGAGRGDYVWARILFPFTMLSALVFDAITAPFIVLGIIQFPLYGFLFGKANALATIACFI